MRILVTGGAGYIGSHMVAALLRAGHDVSVVDNLQSGRRDAVPARVPFLEADVADRVAVGGWVREHATESVIHFAARIQVGESVRDPRLYWGGNVAATYGLLETVLDAGVKNIILSSTAAVYGVPQRVPIPESHPTLPINPYGASKLVIEQMLASYALAYGLRYVALRYFNAAGADADAGLGESHEPETHLIPLVLDAALGKREPLTVYGRDYATPDGTCVRDYVHVVDLCAAHLAALGYLERGGASGAFNVGTGQGASVSQVIASAERISGRKVPTRDGARREGDPPVLVADPSLAAERFGWRAQRTSLDDIVGDAWKWHARGA